MHGVEKQWIKKIIFKNTTTTYVRLQLPIQYDFSLNQGTHPMPRKNLGTVPNSCKASAFGFSDVARRLFTVPCFFFVGKIWNKRSHKIVQVGSTLIRSIYVVYIHYCIYNDYIFYFQKYIQKKWVQTKGTTEDQSWFRTTWNYNDQEWPQSLRRLFVSFRNWP